MLACSTTCENSSSWKGKTARHDLYCHPQVRVLCETVAAMSPMRGDRDIFVSISILKNEENLKKENPRSIENLYLAIHHGCQAGHHAEVFDELVWEETLARFAFRRLNSHGAGRVMR